MKGKIKIRTMKDDLVDASDNINDENEELLETKRDQNKPNIAIMEMAGHDAAPGTTSNKLKDEEIDELKNLINKISEDSGQEKSEEKHIKKEDAVTDIANKKATNEEQEQIDLRGDEKKELKTLINKISGTIEKEEDKAVQAEKSNEKLDREKGDEVKKSEGDKQSFWSDVSEKLKDDKSAEPQRINAIKEKERTMTKSVEDIKSVTPSISEEQTCGPNNCYINNHRQCKIISKSKHIPNPLLYIFFLPSLKTLIALINDLYS